MYNKTKSHFINQYYLIVLIIIITIVFIVINHPPKPYLKIKEIGPVSCVAFSPDGKFLANASMYHGWRLRNAKTGKAIYSILAKDKNIFRIAFSPNGKLIAGIYQTDGVIHLWDTYSGKKLYTLAGQKGRINTISFSPNSELLASSSLEGQVRIWNTKTGQLNKELTISNNNFTSIAFSPNGQILATTAYKKGIFLWKSSSWQLMRRLSKLYKETSIIAFSPDGQRIACDGNGTIKIINTHNWQLIKDIKVSGAILSLAFSSDNENISFGCDNGIVELWNINKKQRKILKGYDYAVESVSFSYDGKILQQEVEIK